MHRRILPSAWITVLLGGLFQVAASYAQEAPVRPAPKISTDGKGLELAAGRPLFKILVDGTGLEQVTRSPERAFGSPDWSPDGDWIACDTWLIGGGYTDSKILVMRADGSKMREIGAGAMPSWSPDGTQLVCHTYESPQTIVTMNVDGSGRETILHHWGSPRWSPKGNRIASIAEGRGTIALFDLTTGKERAIFSGPYSLWQGFSISPDGLRFCFGNEGGGAALATLDERTMRASVRWIVKTGESYNSSWSPDARRIVFSWKPPDSTVYQLYLIDADADEAPQLLKGQDPSRHNTDCDWSPDGTTIIFSSQAP